MDRRSSRLQRVRAKKEHKTRNILFLSLAIIGFLLAFLIMKGLSFYNNIQAKQPTKVNTPTKKPEEQHIYNMLLMGYGGGNHDGTYLTDTIMFIQVDIKKKKAILLSFPRDIWVKLPTKSGDEFHSKINAAYQMGLFPKTFPDVKVKNDDPASVIKEIISNITGEKIDYYATIDFAGFVKTIDILGGIEIDVEKSFDDYEYPIDGKETDPCDKKDQELEDALKIATEDARLAFPCRYEHLSFKKGLTKMDGTTALKYARSRHALADGGDFNRAKRQQKVIEAVKEKMLSVGFIPKIIPLMNELDDNITTDLPLAELNKLILAMGKSNDYTIEKIVLTQENFLTSSRSNNGQYIIIPEAGMDNWTEVQREIKNIKLGITPTPTPTITPTVEPTSRMKKITGTKNP